MLRLNPFIKFINLLEHLKTNHKNTYKIFYIALWIMMPIEMALYKLGIFSYKKIKHYDKKTSEELR